MTKMSKLGGVMTIILFNANGKMSTQKQSYVVVMAQKRRQIKNIVTSFISKTKGQLKLVFLLF